VSPKPRLAAFLVLPVLVSALLLAGCSEKASRLTGNERLIRGDEGFGTTFQSDTLADRDTYVTPATTQIRGATILVGRVGTFEAVGLFRPTTWTLPDTTAIVDSVRFRIEFDSRVDENLPAPGTLFSLHLAATDWDTTNVEWPGPASGTLLGDGPESLAPFTVELGAPAINQVRSWAATAGFPGFILSLDSGTGVRGFLAGTGRIEIVSHPLGGTRTTTVTRIATDLTIHAPAVPATGSETLLELGGLFQSEVLLRAPVAPPPTGFSINAARFVAHVTAPSSPDTVEVRAYRIRRAWTEGAVTDSILGLDATPLATLTGVILEAGDSLTIPIPIGVAREWSVNDASNQGVLLRITNPAYTPAVGLNSRESGDPPVLRVSTTSPPPGRF